MHILNLGVGEGPKCRAKWLETATWPDIVNQGILLAEVHYAVPARDHSAGPAGDAVARRVVIPFGVAVPRATPRLAPVVGPQVLR